jgi:hypothetical protein
LGLFRAICPQWVGSQSYHNAPGQRTTCILIVREFSDSAGEAPTAKTSDWPSEDSRSTIKPCLLKRHLGPST